MPASNDFSATAQYAALGSALRNNALPARPVRKPMPGLEALGRHTGGGTAQTAFPAAPAETQVREAVIA